ncbi:unnamed protein product, partial [Iphiclides podalirius]
MELYFFSVTKDFIPCASTRVLFVKKRRLKLVSLLDEESEVQVRLARSGASWAGGLSAGGGSPRASRRDPSILKGGSFRARRHAEAPAVTFNVENEEDSDEGQITFSARPRPAVQYRAQAHEPPRAPRTRPSSLLVAGEEAPEAEERLSARSRSVEDSTKTDSPIVDLKLRSLKRTAEILKKVGSAEGLTRLKDKIMSRGNGSRERSPPRDEPGSDDESAPLVSSPTTVATVSELHRRSASSSSSSPLDLASNSRTYPTSPTKKMIGIECRDRSLQDVTASTDFSPRSDITDLESPREGTTEFDHLPECKSTDGKSLTKARVDRVDSGSSLSNMVEPYNMYLLSHGTSENSRALWRQNALDSGPPWPWDDEPDSAV